jgi:Fe2+ transport system protein FeoA
MSGAKESKRLIDLDDGQVATIVMISGGRMLIKRLADLGLTNGTEIKVLRRTLFSGPVQVEAVGSRMVLGRGLASKIIVKLR